MVQQIGIIEKYKLATVTVALSIILILGGILYYKEERKKTQTEKYNELNAIAKLKIEQIGQWRKERLSEVVFFSQNEIIVNGVKSLSKGELKAKKTIEKELIHILSNKRYENIFLINPKGLLVFTIDPTFNVVDSSTIKLEQNVSKTKKITFSDFYKCSSHKKTHIDIFAPVFDSDSTIVSTLVFRINPENYLYPFIQSWPTPSKTAETLIVRRDSNDVVFLNRLRHADKEPLTFRIPLTRVDIPAVQAILNHRGLFEGTDYRGMKVLSALDKIPDFPWYMIAKIDLAEIYNDLYIKAILISIIVFVATLLMIFITAWIYLHRQRTIYKELLTQKTELHESQEEFRATLYSIGDGVITTDEKGLVKQINPVAEKLTGWKETEAKGKELNKVFNIISEITRKPVENPVVKVLKEGLIIGLANHTLLVSKDGKEIPIADSGAPIKDEKGGIVGVVLVFRDQTEERKHEKLLEESRERFVHLFERAPLGYQSLDENGNFIEVNQAWLDTLGYAKEEIIGKWFGNILAPPYVETFRERFPLFKKFGKIHSEFEMIHKDGEIRIIAFDGRIGYKNDGDFEKTHCILKDITEQKLVNQKLHDSEERFRLVLENSTDAILITIPDGTILSANKAACEMFGMTEEEICKASRNGITVQDERLNVLLKIRENEGSAKGELTMIRKNGEQFPVELSSSIFYTSKGEARTSMVIRDITERKKNEHERDKLLNILDSSLNEIYIFDADTLKFKYLNRGALNNLGYSIDEIKSLTPIDIKPEYTIESFKELINPLILENEKILVFQTIHKRKDDTIYPVEVHLQLHKVNHSTVFFAIINDITERKEFENDLLLNEKRLSTIFDTVGDILYYIAIEPDNKFRFISINDTFCRVTGIPEEMVVGKLLNDIIPEPSLTMVLEKYNQAIKERRMVKWEETTNYPSGELTGEVSISPVYDNKGKCTYLVGSVHDITERKKFEIELSKSKSFIETIIENLPIGLAVNTVEPTVSFEYMNDNFLKFYHTSREKIASPDTFWDAIYEDPIQRNQIRNQILSDISSGDPNKMYWPDIPIFKDGMVLKYISARNIPLYDKNLMISTVWDVTEQKRAEEQIKELNLKLNLLITTLNKLTKAQSIEELEQIVTTSARQLIGSDGCTFVLREGETCFYANEDAISSLWKGKKFPLETCVSGWVMINKEIAIIPDIYKDDRVPVDAYEPTFVKSMVMVPLGANQPFGAIGNYWSKEHLPTDDEIKLISTLADATSRVYENLRMYEDLERKVKEKTKELNEHIKELERFHDATIDRELRIKELREELKRLKG